MGFSRMACWGVAGAICFFAGALRADWTLTTADFSQQKGLTVNTWDIGEGLSVTGESGKLVKVDTRNVLSLISSKAKENNGGAGGGATWRLVLRNGDVIYGEPVRMTGQSMEYTMPELGKILVPLKMIAGMGKVLAGQEGAVSGNTEKDTVLTIGGEVIGGLILNITPDKIQFVRSVEEKTPLDIVMTNVARLTFGGTTPARTVPPLAVRVSFVSGSVLTVPLDAKQKSFSWSINSVQLKDPAGQDRKAAADAITEFNVVGGRVVGLTELDPAKDEQTTFMGTQWATQVNKNVLGDPLKVAKKVYAHGLGVHTKSDLTYALDGSFDTLKLRVGMDDSAAPQGAANVSVVLDGKVLWEQKGIKAGQISEELSLPISGGKKLELRADPALEDGKLDVLGRVDWVNAALVRK